MDYEKLYKEALDNLNRIKNESPEWWREHEKTMQEIFPGFFETENERIREAIIKIINRYAYNSNTLKPKMLAWLEKQGDQTKFIEAIQVGDKVTRNEDGVLVNLSQLNRVAKKDENKGEQILANSAKTCKDEQNPAWSEEDVRNIQDIDSVLFYDKNLPEDTRIRLRNWLKHLKDRVQPQPKQEWSEEDESRDYKDLIGELQSLLFEWSNKKDNMGTCINRHLQKIVSSIKSLRPQSTWKPSDEQMSALSKAIAFVFDSNSDVKHSLESLYNELKKL